MDFSNDIDNELRLSLVSHTHFVVVTCYLEHCHQWLSSLRFSELLVDCAHMRVLMEPSYHKLSK